MTRVPPPWVQDSSASAWLRIGNDYVAPLRKNGEELVAVTLMYRGSVGPDLRKRVNRAKAARRAGRASQRRIELLHSKKRLRPGPDPGEWAA